MPDIFIPPSHQMIKLLTAQEYDDFYGVPYFNAELRAQFFSLSLHGLR